LNPNEIELRFRDDPSVVELNVMGTISGNGAGQRFNFGAHRGFIEDANCQTVP
jgi:hypothetical protein